MECVSALTWSTWAPDDAFGTGNSCIALPEDPCVSKMIIACLASCLGVSPFKGTQDPMVDAKLDFLYRDAMGKLDEVDDEACIKYVARKIHPRTRGPLLLSRPALLLRAPSTAPLRPPMGPARNVARPSPMMRVKQPSNC
jgi:hypothetical protein